MPRVRWMAVALLVVPVGLACTLSRPPYRPAPSGPFEPPDPPPVDSGPLSLTVVYPPTGGEVATAGSSIVVSTDEDYRIQSRDSTFVFGGVGNGAAELSVNGNPVPVHPKGGWIAWLPLTADSVAQFDILATLGVDTARLLLEAPIVRAYEPPDSSAWIDTTSFHPTGDRWIERSEGLALTVRAAPGARVSGLVNGATVIEFAPATTPSDVPAAEQAPDSRAPTGGRLPARADRYVAWWSGRLGPDPDLVLAPNFPALDNDSLWLQLRVVAGGDTAQSRWPLRMGLIDGTVPTTVVLSDDHRGSGQTDGIVVGRPSPFGTYHWFFPNGTIAVVNGRWNSQARLSLSRSSVAWVSTADLYPLRPGTPPPHGTVGSMRLTPGPQSVVLRVPLPVRLPFHVDEWGNELYLTFYGTAANADWIHYGGTDSLIQLVSFSQPALDETQVTVSLSSAVWGYRTRWDGTDLLLEIRRPPVIESKQPLAGRVIAIDAGHPPLGARGPTGLWEPEITLEIARKTARLLEQYGVSVILTRQTDEPVALMERPKLAEDAGAELLVSIHANALPDGVNPFESNGTSVYYFYPRSAPLARELNRALVRQFGYGDLGMGRGNLALARTTWMPAVLAEGLFMMIPEQETVLASEEGQWRYARGIVEGVASFLHHRSANPE